MDERKGLHLMTSAEIGEVHAASLRILQDVGVKFPHEKLLGLFKEHGAKVDAASGLVKIPAGLVE